MSPPNILFILTDQQRFDSLGCYGADFAHTPNLDRLAAEGVLFENCYVNNPICTPSRASMLTGLPLPEHGVNRLYDILPEDQTLFTCYLQEAGYRTGLIGKLHVSDYKEEAVRRHPNDGFDVYEWCHEPVLALDAPWNGYSRYLAAQHPDFLERLRNEGRAVEHFPADCHMSYWCAEETIRFIGEPPEDQPFFALMSLFDPHNPYHDFPEGYDRLVDREKLPPLLGLECDMSAMPEGVRKEHRLSHMGAFADFSAKEIDAVRMGYHASIAFLDEQMGKVLAALEERGLAENTLIVFTSDHGDNLGDHQLLVKGAAFYDPCTRVPMILRWPAKISGGRKVERVVQPNDVAATFLGAAGLDDLARSKMPDSMDLIRAALDDQGHEYAMCHYLGTGIKYGGGYFDPPTYGSMIRDQRYKLNIYWDDSSCSSYSEGQLFDLVGDPDELHDLWKDPERAGIKENLATKLQTGLK